MLCWGIAKNSPLTWTFYPVERQTLQNFHQKCQLDLDSGIVIEPPIRERVEFVHFYGTRR